METDAKSIGIYVSMKYSKFMHTIESPTLNKRVNELTLTFFCALKYSTSELPIIKGKKAESDKISYSKCV